MKALTISPHFIVLLLLFACGQLVAQDSTENITPVKKAKPVKNTFESSVIMDNQTVMVPAKGSLEMTIQHRFGTLENGSTDFFGLWAPSNIRLGMSYAPVKNWYVGLGVTKEKAELDANIKYAWLHQTPGVMPVSVSYFGNVVVDTRNKENFRYTADRFSYFNQLIIARKISSKFSAQVAPSISWYNNVEAYINSKNEIKSKMNNYHLAVSLVGRYKVSEKSAVTVGYDQPLTQHLTNNPHPNICFGFETNTSSHSFQVFFGNYYSIVPERNNMYNQNDYTKGQFLIGFNITRLWSY
jgi:hypothetical protein